MSERGDQGFWANVRDNWPLSFAAFLTAAFLAWTLWLFLHADCGMVNCENRLDQFLDSSNSEMGDTLAGFVGSLTLIWVVASVLQQSMELRAQRNEFAAMVRAQDAQVEALKAQAAIFEDERQRRNEDQALEILNSRVSLLMNILTSSTIKNFRFDSTHPECSAAVRLDNIDEDDRLRACNMYLIRLVNAAGWLGSGKISVKPGQNLQDICSKLKEIPDRCDLIQECAKSCGARGIEKLKTINDYADRGEIFEKIPEAMAKIIEAIKAEKATK